MSYAIVSYLHVEDSIKTSHITTVKDIHEAHAFINDMCRIQIDKLEIISGILEKLPTNTDSDGYYLVYNENQDGCNRYKLYKKNINMHLGYIWNSATISITYIGFIDILNLDIQEKIKSGNTIYSNKPTTFSNTTNTKIPKHQENQIKCNVELISELKNKLNELNLAKVKKD